MCSRELVNAGSHVTLCTHTKSKRAAHYQCLFFLISLPPLSLRCASRECTAWVQTAYSMLESELLICAPLFTSFHSCTDHCSLSLFFVSFIAFFYYKEIQQNRQGRVLHHHGCCRPVCQTGRESHRVPWTREGGARALHLGSRQRRPVPSGSSVYRRRDNLAPYRKLLQSALDRVRIL